MTAWLTHMNALGCGALEATREGNIVRANRILHDMAGQDPQDMRLVDLFDQGTKAFWVTSIQPLLELKQHAYDVAVTLDTNTGKRWALAFCAMRGDIVEVLLVPFHERQEFERAMAAARKQEQESRAALRRLEELDGFRADFLNSLSHELSTPLTPVILQLSRLKALAANDEQQHAIQVMERNIKQLQEFNESLMAASRMQAGAWSGARTLLDLRAPVEQAIAVAQGTMPQVIRLEGAPGKGCANHDAIQECIVRLLDNCRKFCPPDATVTVTTSPGQISVVDTGPGIQSEKLPRLGRPFSKGHSDRENSQLGAGLGLYLVRATMEAMGGSMSVDADDAGTRVTLRVPAECPPTV